MTCTFLVAGAQLFVISEGLNTKASRGKGGPLDGFKLAENYRSFALYLYYLNTNIFNYMFVLNLLCVGTLRLFLEINMRVSNMAAFPDTIKAILSIEVVLFFVFFVNATWHSVFQAIQDR